jgi:gentisate 1,2-dioxygenase
MRLEVRNIALHSVQQRAVRRVFFTKQPSLHHNFQKILYSGTVPSGPGNTTVQRHETAGMRHIVTSGVSTIILLKRMAMH